MPSLSHSRRYENLLAACAGLPPATVAVVHPCDTSSLEGALAARKQGIISPVLVGPKAKILQAAENAGLDIGGLPIEDAPHSDAAAEAAVALVRQGRCEALMKGSLHSDELMRPVVARDGLRTKRRISHCFILDVPGHKDPLIISDAAVNISPSLADKVHIVQNAIDLAHALLVPGYAKPEARKCQCSMSTELS